MSGRNFLPPAVTLDMPARASRNGRRDPILMTERSTVRKVLAIVLPALLLLTACGADEGETAGDAAALESVEVTVEDQNKAPQVEFDTPLDVSEPSVRVVVKGDGDTIEDGQLLSMRLISMDPEKGEELGNTYEEPEPQTLPLNDEFKKANEELYDVLIGSKVGSQIAYMRPAEEAEAAKIPNQLLVINVLGAEDPEAPPAAMSQEKVKELQAAGALPSAKLDSKGVPSISIPKGKEAPKEVAVEVLKAGDGAEVTESSTVKADYLGVRWEDGKTFDSSYAKDREPIEFSMAGGVIEGWTVGVLGHKAGSELLVSIPAELAYGEEAAEGQPAGPLVFYIKLIDATEEAAE